MNQEDKRRALETAVASIEKDYGKGSIMRLGDNTAMNIETIPTGSVSLDIALGLGGIPKDDACPARGRGSAEARRHRRLRGR